MDEKRFIFIKKLEWIDIFFHLTKKKTNFVFANNNFYNSSFSEPKQAIQGLFFAFFLAPPVLENHSTKSVQVEEEKLQS